jgi:hypothetical protein
MVSWESRKVKGFFEKYGDFRGQKQKPPKMAGRSGKAKLPRAKYP